MNLEAGAALAEIVSAIGVIVTLAYLAYEISQANRIAHSSAIREVEQQYLDFYRLLATEPVFTELSLKLRAPGYRPDTNLEAEQATNFVKLLVTIWFGAQTAYDRGLMDDATFQIYLDDVKVKLADWPAIRPYAARFINDYPTTREMAITAPVFVSPAAQSDAR